MRIGIVCVAVAWAGLATAAPKPNPKAKQAQQLVSNGLYSQALVIIDEGLATTPDDLPLLKLRGQVLFKLNDLPAALAAYQAYIAAGATGADKRVAQNITADLVGVQSTFLDVTVTNGPADVYLDTRTAGKHCRAEPSCSKVVFARAYKVIAERPGFQTWTGPVTVKHDQHTQLTIALVEKPSLLTVHVAQPGATITVDGKPYASGAVPAGRHQVVVTLEGHVTSRLDAVAAEGKPVALDVALVRRIPVRVTPATAELRLDNQPIAAVEGGLEVPPGAHVLVVRAPSFVDRRVDIPATRPDDYAITVELTSTKPVAVTPGSRFTTRRKIALAVGGVGVAAAVAGAALGVQSKQLEDDAFARCPSPTTPCGAALEANDLNKRGQSRALQANVAFGVAAGAAITAAVLWFTGAPETSVAVSPRIGPVAGLDVSLRF